MKKYINLSSQNTDSYIQLSFQFFSQIFFRNLYSIIQEKYISHLLESIQVSEKTEFFLNFLIINHSKEEIIEFTFLYIKEISFLHQYCIYMIAWKHKMKNQAKVKQKEKPN